MDKQFLEFWGNLLLQAAQGQARIENMTAWLNQGSGTEGFAALFKRIYNLNPAASPSGDDQATWQEAMDRFKQAQEGYLSLLNAVPLERYRELESHNAVLQKENSRQQQEIERLRRSLQRDGSDTDETVQEWQALLAKQQREFHDLTDQFRALWSKKSGSGPGTAK